MESHEFSFGRETQIEALQKKLIEKFEEARISTENAGFEELYIDYHDDMKEVDKREGDFSRPNDREIQLGKVAEALVYDALSKHEVNGFLKFRAASRYDDLFNGTDILVEPNTTTTQAFAGIDVTINQANPSTGIDTTKFSSEEVSSALGLEEKLKRAKTYIDELALYGPDEARELLSWLEGNKLKNLAADTEAERQHNKIMRKKANKVISMKYYRTPDDAPVPGQPSYVIGGPHPVISVDSYFINQALQGGRQRELLIADLAIVEFVLSIQSEAQYLEKLVRVQKQQNVLFDKHFAKVKGWLYIFKNPELSRIVSDIIQKYSRDRVFQEQLRYFSQTLKKVYELE